MTEFSQVSCIGEPQPRSWDDFERGCMGTYRGGHHEPETAEAFCHGMATVFNLLRAEFPPAGLCKASPDLLELALEVAKEYEDAADWKDAIGRLQRMARAAIDKAQGGQPT